MRALITGATGFVGKVLVSQIPDAVVLSRNPQRAEQALPGVRAFAWNAEQELPPAEAFEGVQAVFHLAGEPVAEGRWNAAKRRRIRDSRVLGTRHLVERLSQLSERPRVLVSASAIGWYGDRGDDLLDEHSSPGSDFLAEVCKGWEAEATKAADLGIRTTCARIGIVLGDDGGALAKMLTPFKLGVGGRLASGNQYMSWVHVDDVVGLLWHAALAEGFSGPMNTVGPHPVTNREFTKVLASVVHRPALFPAPAFALKLALGDFAEVLLASQRVIPRHAQETGYQFVYADLRSALEAAVAGKPHQVSPALAGSPAAR